ncbi:MAG TPA: CUAEP/CCAEP-tail radical SAM protein [Anaeromyxobacteraceae bacterium]|nr:CUAEP/CCAEP-tail radical SAM protein [Anaeromyxobacteraceae bacterium]
MHEHGAILLASTYELGHQPSGITFPKAFLERAGFSPATLDLAVEELDAGRIRAARLVAISVPMHTALRLGLAAAARIRALNPSAALCFHGLYAPLHAPLLRQAGAVAVLGGECEEELVALADALERGADLSRFVHASGATAPTDRLDYPVPSRSGLPPPARYAGLDEGGTVRLAGYTDATRGCLHRCRHCPIPAVYDGRFVAIPEDVVRRDVAQQVAAGVTHVTFGDPDFLNGPTHARRVLRALHSDHPSLTFDFTAKVEHLVRHAALLPELRADGAIFVVSAVESLSERVLEKLDKGHTRDDVFRAFAACQAAALTLRPTLVPFTPWSTLDDYLDLLEVFEREGWAESLDPVQLSIRLLVPAGSLLAGDPELALEDYDAATLGFPWRHPDPRVDALQAKVASCVEDGATRAERPLDTFARVRALALAAAGRPHAHVARRSHSSGRAAPRLTESWFC